ncbi:MAG: aspartate aminotransferase family protein [Desulfobacterales bacterium]|nr:aspartate aminotransferase family protein [Desulfobacterales bacterium]
MATKQEIFDLFARHVSSGKSKYFMSYGIDFIFGRREGPYIWDIDESKRLINCHSNGGVFNLGHRNLEIIKSLQQALDDTDIGNHHFVSTKRAELAAKIANLMPGDLKYVVFGVSGGEAIDTAIKIARKATGRKKIISAKGGYHGHTGLALAAGNAKFSAPFLSESDDFIHVPFNDIAALEEQLDGEIAAVILETIPATVGMLIPDNNYLPEVKKLCQRNGSLYIADEVQTGLGRTGKLWGFEHYGVEPDIVVIGKGLSGGIYPITATVIQSKLEAVFHEDPFLHISTFGGAEPGCVVAEKVLEISSSTVFLNRVNALSEIFQKGILELQKQYSSLFIEFRQKGLMMGLKMSSPDYGLFMSKACFDAGLLCVYSALDYSVVQFLPVLIIDEALSLEIIERLSNALSILKRFIEYK